MCGLSGSVLVELRTIEPMSKPISRILVMGALLAVFVSCASADITWTLNNVYFDYNAETNQAVGSFTVNTAVTGIVDWSIDISGTNPAGVFDFVPANSSVFSFAPTKIIFTDPTFNFITIFLPGGGGITNTPGTLPLLVNIGTGFTETSFNCAGCGTLRGSADPSITGTAVPEPTSILLVGGMLLAVAGTLRRRLS